MWCVRTLESKMKISLQHVLFDFVIDGLTKFETRKNKKKQKTNERVAATAQQQPSLSHYGHRRRQMTTSVHSVNVSTPLTLIKSESYVAFMCQAIYLFIVSTAWELCVVVYHVVLTSHYNKKNCFNIFFCPPHICNRRLFVTPAHLKSKWFCCLYINVALRTPSFLFSLSILSVFLLLLYVILLG